MDPRTMSVAASINPAQRQRRWLALSLTPQLGPTRGRRLVEHFNNDIDRVFHASLTELEAAGIPAASAQAIALGKSWELSEDEFAKTAGARATIVAIGDPEYPPRLMEIYDPPLALRVRGDVSILSKPGIAVVGTRHPTPYGLGMAERLSCDLAARGLIIISGLARGVDTAAHRGTVNARSKTIAVFGTGVDEIYPRANKKLAEQILEFGGALISEFPTGTFPAPQNFPIRNRIISGLSVGVLVIEAGEYSGTRITSRCALEQCREVFAVPGNVTNKLSWGPNTLIKQGAKLTATWEDIWEELPSDVRLQVPTPEPVATESQVPASLFQQQEMPAQERKVYALLRADESVHIDELIEKLDGRLSSAEIFSALFELEMASKIRQMPGKYYVRTM
ncbi:MAG TPA: DNA-processing protein DprA [Candidatus Koribacter sp.]|jgi:DNA processing protein